MTRPNPDELLRRLEATEVDGKRGRLKVFLGYASRVGKSERMLDECRRRAERGQDVLIAATPAKGIFDVGQIDCIAMRDGDMDVEAVIVRHPALCMVDELANLNGPGSVREHRWQDVEALLAAGINVITALNVQYIAEQQDAVERITGRRAASSVPGAFIQSADEIVVVDAPAEQETRQSLELRELALLLAAEVVEAQLQRYLDLHGIYQAWGTQERILVCLTPHSSVRAMVESGRRSADRFHGPLLALYVENGELSRELEEKLDENLEYATRLGAEVHRLKGADAVCEILGFANEQRITQIFVGHTAKSRWRFWEKSQVERLIRACEGIDVRVFPHARAG